MLPPLPMRIDHLPGRGRGLVATRAIAKGELVLTEAPLVCVPATARADGCPHPPWAALGGGAATLDAEWAAMKGQQFPRVCLRVLGLLLAQPSIWQDQLRHLCFPTMDDGGWPEEWNADFKRARSVLLGTAGDAPSSDEAAPVSKKDFDSMFAPSVWGTLMGMAHLNTFRLQCGDGSSGGSSSATESTCLFVVGSFFNHDCNANVQISAANDSDTEPIFAFTAVRDVEEGQELCSKHPCTPASPLLKKGASPLTDCLWLSLVRGRGCSG